MIPFCILHGNKKVGNDYEKVLTYVPINKNRGIDENDTDPKKVAIWKTCKFTFFSWKMWNIKKYFFIKVPKTAKSYLHGLLFKNGIKK